MDVVVDTSAAVAIVAGESAGSWVAHTLDSTERRFMSSGSFVELAIVLTHKLGPVGPTAAEHLVRSLAIQVVDVDARQAGMASRGFVRFGKGRHPASLNFGDCFVYGLAADLRLPVVCLGDDFPQTDLDTISPGDLS
jgi:ribonuclease VapC